MRIARLIALAGATLAWLVLAGAAPTPDATDRAPRWRGRRSRMSRSSAPRGWTATSLRPKDRP